MIQPIIAKRDVTKHILKSFNIHMSKKLGQNFLIDESIVDGIVDAADIQEGETVLEIGVIIVGDAVAVHVQPNLPFVVLERGHEPAVGPGYQAGGIQLQHPHRAQHGAADHGVIDYLRGASEQFHRHLGAF